MTKQQKNKAFAEMLKEFPKAFGRVSFRERLMLRTAFTYVVEEVISDIEKENEELRNNGFTVSAMTEQQLKVALEKGEQLEKENKTISKKANEAIADKLLITAKYNEVLNDLNQENDKLKKENAELNNFIMQSKKDGISPINALIIKNLGNQLIKAKEIIKDLLEYSKEHWLYSDIKKQAEQFLKEVEK